MSILKEAYRPVEVSPPSDKFDTIADPSFRKSIRLFHKSLGGAEEVLADDALRTAMTIFRVPADLSVRGALSLFEESIIRNHVIVATSKVPEGGRRKKPFFSAEAAIAFAFLVGARNEELARREYKDPFRQIPRRLVYERVLQAAGAYPVRASLNIPQ